MVRMRIAAVSLLLALAMLPAASGATTIIDDATGDAGPLGVGEVSDAASGMDLDTVSVEYDPSTDAITMTISLASLSEDQAAALAATRTGWMVNWTTPDGVEMALRADVGPIEVVQGLTSEFSVSTKLCKEGSEVLGAGDMSGDNAISIGGGTVSASFAVSNGDAWNMRGINTDPIARTIHYGPANTCGSPDLDQAPADRGPDEGVGSKFLAGSGEPRFTLSVDPSEETLKLGERTTVELTVGNEGTGSGTVELQAQSPDTWDIAIDQDTIPLDPGNESTVEATIAIRSSAESGVEEDVTFEALDGPVVDSANVTITVPESEDGSSSGVAEPTISADKTEAEAAAGGEAAYELTVGNPGDVEATYDLSVDGAGWATVDPAELTIAAGGNESATVDVAVPSDASDSATHTVTVAAASDSSVKATLDLTTTVEDASSPDAAPGLPGFEVASLVVAGLAALLIRRRW